MSIIGLALYLLIMLVVFLVGRINELYRMRMLDDQENQSLPFTRNSSP